MPTPKISLCDWKCYMIDHSRTFKCLDQLKSPKDLTQFSTSLMEALEKLNEETVKSKCGKYQGHHFWATIPGTVPHGGTRGFPIQGVPLRGTLPGARCQWIPLVFS